MVKALPVLRLVYKGRCKLCGAHAVAVVEYEGREYQVCMIHKVIAQTDVEGFAEEVDYAER